MRCPATKFITHTFSHITFLILLAAATFRIEDKGYHVTSVNALRDDPYDPETHQDKVESLLKGTLRPANSLITNVQICLMFWVLGEYHSRGVDSARNTPGCVVTNCREMGLISAPREGSGVRQYG